jgi:hypothetical protein
MIAGNAQMHVPRLPTASICNIKDRALVKSAQVRVGAVKGISPERT